MAKKISKKKPAGKKIKIDGGIISALGIANIPLAKQKRLLKNLKKTFKEKLFWLF